MKLFTVDGKAVVIDGKAVILRDSVVDTSGATAIADDLVLGKIAFANGEYLVGTHVYDPGLDTSDATATAADIAAGKTAYVNGELLTGTCTPATVKVLNESALTQYSEDGDLVTSNVGIPRKIVLNGFTWDDIEWAFLLHNTADSDEVKIHIIDNGVLYQTGASYRLSQVESSYWNISGNELNFTGNRGRKINYAFIVLKSSALSRITN